MCTEDQEDIITKVWMLVTSATSSTHVLNTEFIETEDICLGVR